MQNNKEKNDVNNTLRSVRNFFIIVSIIVGTFLIFASLGVFAYTQVMKNSPFEQKNEDENPSDDLPVASPEPTATTDPKQGGFIANLMTAPKKTNFLVMGVDKLEMLTDVIIVGSFDSETKQIDLISVPRDTYIEMNKADVTTIKNLGRSVPEHGVMKINAIHSYAGSQYGTEFLKKQIEGMMGIKIDYYAEVNLKAFKNIVNTIGGVEMDVPAGGLYYKDPDQNLVISVPGGRQILDGEKAEGVVRYRATYARGDLQRIEVQQEFMKRLFAQVMNKETLTKNAASFIGTIISYVKTDFGIQDSPMYLRYLNDISGENLTIHTLPGYSEDGTGYFIYDKAKTLELADEIFTVREEPSPEPSAINIDPSRVPSKVDVKKLKVQILNGSNTSGLAGSAEKRLKQAGVTVSDIGDYGGTQKKYTRVVTKTAGVASLFEPYFDEVHEEVDSQLPQGFDIVIIIGTGQKE